MTADEITAEETLQFYIENKAHLQPWEMVKDQSFYTVTHHKQRLDHEISKLSEKKGVKLYLKLAGSEDIAGIINFDNIVYGAFLSCTLGYSMGEKYLRQGYMFEALNRGVEIMFSEYGLHRIEGNVIPRNERSLKLLAKAGFYDEGLAKKYLKINGVWEDHIHMVLFNEELE